MSWQIQEAKQRFSAVLRAARDIGPQIISKHGEDVAVVIDIREYRRLAEPKPDVKALLLGPPHYDDRIVAVLEEIELERKADKGRDLDLGLDG